MPPFEPSGDGFSDDDAAFLAANGFNVVRVGIFWAAIEPEPGVFNDAYLASVAQTVQMLARHGIVSLLDMAQDSYSSTIGGPGGGEGMPAWATETGGLPNPPIGFPYDNLLNPADLNAWSAFFANAKAPDGVGLENSFAQMWEHVADYFKGNPDVVGDEIMDEPWPGFSWPGILLGSPAFGAGELTPFFNQVDSAIRAVDPTTPVWIEPNLIFEDAVSPITLGTVHDPHTVFTFENYCLAETLFGSDFGCPQTDELVMDRAQAYADSQGIPAVITEFGNGDTPDSQMQSLADQHQFGWMYWSYMYNNDITGSSSATALVQDPNQPPAGANL
ncbi:MAG: glycoside hydrolase family 5 protein, partial [Mycobacterium sp.]